MTIQDRAFTAVMLAAETFGDFRLFMDFCLFTSVLAMTAPLSVVAILPEAGRNFINRVERGLAPANREGVPAH